MVDKKKSSDFENRFFDLLEGTIEAIDKKVDEVVGDVKDNSKRIAKLENAIFPEQVQNAKNLPAWYRDPSLIKLLSLLFGAIIIIASLAAALLGKPLPNIFGRFF